MMEHTAVSDGGPGKLADFQTFEGGINKILMVTSQDPGTAWRAIAEWQKDLLKMPGIGKQAYKIHSYTLTPITINSKLMPQGVPAILLVVVMEKVTFDALLKNQ